MFAIIAAGGNGSRLGNTKKQFLKIAGGYILKISVKKLLSCGIRRIVVATQKEDFAIAQNILQDFIENVSFCQSGNSRQETVKLAFLSEYKNFNETDIVVIHDAARPFFSVEDVVKLIDVAKEKKAATLCCPVVDTVKLLKENRIEKTINREFLALSQTPQAFEIALYEKALKMAEKKNLTYTDDCQLIENLNKKIEPVFSTKTNFKITTKEDLKLAEFLIKEAKNV